MNYHLGNYHLLGAAALMGILSLLSCSSTPQVTEKTSSRVYNAPFEATYNASIKAFLNLNLEVFKKSKEQGYVEGGRDPGVFRGAETVGIFIEKTSANKTTARIDNRKNLFGWVFAKNWTNKLFAEIEKELQSKT